MGDESDLEFEKSLLDLEKNRDRQEKREARERRRIRQELADGLHDDHESDDPETGDA